MILHSLSSFVQIDELRIYIAMIGLPLVDISDRLKQASQDQSHLSLRQWLLDSFKDAFESRGEILEVHMIGVGTATC